MNKIERKTHHIDAAGKSVGRIATQVATLLIGKGKATYEPHIDNGDFVEVINAAQVKVTGQKLEQKIYRRHTGYVGNMKEWQMKEIYEKNPEKLIVLAVAKMLPKNRTRAKRMLRLTVKK